MLVVRWWSSDLTSNVYFKTHFSGRILVRPLEGILAVGTYRTSIFVLDPFGRIRSAEGLAEILLARGAILITLLNGSGELDWVRIDLIVFKISS